jgi:hypothetical protein
VAKDADKQVNKTCAMCVHACKQRPDCTVVMCRQYEKRDEESESKRQTSRSARFTR